MTKLKQGSLLKKKALLIIEGVLLLTLILSSMLIYTSEKRQVDTLTQDKIADVSNALKQKSLDVTSAQGYLELNINQKLNIASQLVTKTLGNKTIDEITNDELLKLSSDLNLKEITLYELQGEQIIGQKSTEPKNINLPLEVTTPKKEEVTPVILRLMQGESVSDVSMVYTKDSYLAVPLDLTEEKPLKHVFYKPTDKPYLIGIKTSTEEIVLLEQSIGTGAEINAILERDNLVKEVAFLDLDYYKKESLTDNENTSIEGVLQGIFKLSDSKDTQALKAIAQKEQTISYVTSREEGDVYKAFIPANGKVLYIALDYTALQHSLSGLKTILILTGLVTLVTTGIVLNILLNKNYRNLQIVKSQIKSIASGDFTAINEEELKDDLKAIGETVNSMVQSLNRNFSSLLQQLENLQGVTSQSSKGIEGVAMNLSKETKIFSHNLSTLKQDIEASLDVAHHKLVEGVPSEDLNKVLKELENLRHRVKDTDVMYSLDLTDLKTTHTRLVECTKTLSNIVNNIYKYKL